MCGKHQRLEPQAEKRGRPLPENEDGSEAVQAGL